MKILDRLPITDEHLLMNVRGRPLKLRPYQIGIRVSIVGSPAWDARAPIIPALLDTGNNLNISIQEHQLAQWAGIHPESLPFLREVREGGRTPSLRFAKLWIHRNRAGSRDLSDAKPFPLQLPEGIAIYPSDGSDFPRLPLLGLRAIVKNKLKLLIDGKWRHASLRSPIW